jgi:hypothetical protein
MAVGVIKRGNDVYIVRYNGQPSKDQIQTLPEKYGPIDTQFLIQLPDGTYKVCEKKRSAWMKEQIKNGISE